MSARASTANSAGAINRITKEIAHIQKGTDLSLAVGYREADVRHIRGLIIGPPETPYEFGFFEFDIRFPKTYPIESPSVRCMSTNAGRTRFNPNIYGQGKVCLSILGTWRGEEGEQWSSAQGLESVMLSIQSLMSSNPYENEPGFENTKLDAKEAQEYARKIRHETLRITVIERLEQILRLNNDTGDRLATALSRVDEETNQDAAPGADEEADSDDQTPNTDPSVHEYDAESSYNALDPTSPWDPFADLIKRRFLWYYDSYLRAIDSATKEQKDGKIFPTADFEHPGNTMQGSYQYFNLRARLERIRSALADETEKWKQAGAKQVAESTQLATQLAFQFKQLQYTWNETNTYPGARIELSLPDPTNPFIWNLTLFGDSSDPLEGGVFNFTLAIPPTFPDAWPRITMQKPILFHHRIGGSTGVVCYFPTKPDEIGEHIFALRKAVQDKGEQRYDPRALVNPEASELFWGGEAKRKVYVRRLRRCAEDSVAF